MPKFNVVPWLWWSLMTIQNSARRRQSGSKSGGSRISDFPGKNSDDLSFFSRKLKKLSFPQNIHIFTYYTYILS